MGPCSVSWSDGLVIISLALLILVTVTSISNLVPNCQASILATIMQVNLGVIDANPSSAEGAITIMSELQKYVPRRGNELHQLVCHVDGGAHERMVDAKFACRAKASPVGRLEGLLPNAQEFHKRMLKLQVCAELFHSWNVQYMYF